MAVARGGSTLLYVGGHDREVCARVAEWLQRQAWTGVILAREAIPGTFLLHEARVDSPDAPDLIVSLGWSRERSANGTPGLGTSDLSPSSTKAGNHGSLSAYDMPNMLVAAGPDFRAGITDPLPSGNIDVAPTVLWLLGLKTEALRMDGRVLGEALTVPAPPLQSVNLARLTAHRRTSAGVWEQYLQVSELNGVRYLDEGSGGGAGP